MSTIGVYRRHISETTAKAKRTRSNRQDCFVILATSSILFGIVLITMLMGPVIIASTNGLTMDDISD